MKSYMIGDFLMSSSDIVIIIAVLIISLLFTHFALYGKLINKMLIEDYGKSKYITFVKIIMLNIPIYIYRISAQNNANNHL